MHHVHLSAIQAPLSPASRGRRGISIVGTSMRYSREGGRGELWKRLCDARDVSSWPEDPAVSDNGKGNM